MEVRSKYESPLVLEKIEIINRRTDFMNEIMQKCNDKMNKAVQCKFGRRH